MFVTVPKFIQSLFSSIIWRKETINKEIWLTFDDGPHPEVTPWILSVLKEEKVKATFFLLGEKIEEFPYLKTKILNEGHTIGNHSYSHRNGWICNNDIYFNDIDKCQKLMPENKLFRPPFGKITIPQLVRLRKIYKIVLWDVLSLDFQKNITPNKVEKNILRNTSHGSIIVLHNNKKSYRKLQPILSRTIQNLKKSGFNFSATW